MDICVQLEQVFKAFGAIILQKKFLLKNLNHGFKIFCFQNSFQLGVLCFTNLEILYCLELLHSQQLYNNCFPTEKLSIYPTHSVLALRKTKIVETITVMLNPFFCICGRANLMLVKYISGILTTHQNCIQYSCKFYFLQVRR